jgi:hypothetical protein
MKERVGFVSLQSASNLHQNLVSRAMSQLDLLMLQLELALVWFQHSQHAPSAQ